MCVYLSMFNPWDACTHHAGNSLVKATKLSARFCSSGGELTPSQICWWWIRFGLSFQQILVVDLLSISQMERKPRPAAYTHGYIHGYVHGCVHGYILFKHLFRLPGLGFLSIYGMTKSDEIGILRNLLKMICFPSNTPKRHLYPTSTTCHLELFL